LEFNQKISSVDKNEIENIKYFIVNNPESLLNEAYEPLCNLLFKLRTDYKLFVQFVLMMEQEDFNELSDLFSLRFFENILVKNPEQDELLIILSLQIIQEINSMYVPSVKSFLDNSFVGKMLKLLSKRQDIKQFFFQWTNELIMKMEHSLDNFWDLDVNRIFDYLKKQKTVGSNKCFFMEKSKELFEINIANNLVNKTRGTTFYAKFNQKISVDGANKTLNDFKNLEVSKDHKKERSIQISLGLTERKDHIKSFITEENKNSRNNNNTKKSMFDIPFSYTESKVKTNNNNNNEIQDTLISDDENSLSDEEGGYNEDYFKDLTSDELIKRVINEKNEIRKDYLIKQVEKAGKIENLFTNNKLIESFNNLKTEQAEKHKVMTIFKKNFELLKSFLDELLAGITSKVDFMPYSLRCICKVIEISIKAKFPEISECEVQSFIGEFIFGKLFLPMLGNPDYNAIITTTVLSYNTRKNLLNISKIIKKMYRFELFESNYESNFTMFNHYLLEMLPVIMRFFGCLSDVHLTETIEKICNANSNNMKLANLDEGEEDEFFSDDEEYSSIKPKDIKDDSGLINQSQSTMVSIKDKEITGNINLNEENLVKDIYSIPFNYFEIMKDQLINLHSICFSINEILALMTVFSRNIKELKKDKANNLVVKSYEKLTFQENYFKSLVKNDIKLCQKRHFLIFRHSHNPAYKHLLTVKNEVFTCSDFNESLTQENKEFIIQRVKYCITFILRKLNMINPKSYSFMRDCSQTLDFFNGINEIVQLQDQNSMIDKIPLSWYSIYLNSNICKLENEYSDNNYIKLYDELNNEVNLDTNLVVEKTNSIITHLGQNVRVADKILEDVIKDKYNVRNIERLIRLEKFIIQAEVPVCVKVNTQSKDSEESPLIVSSIKTCYHNKLIFLDRVIEGNKVMYNNYNGVSSGTQKEKDSKNKNKNNSNHINRNLIDEHAITIFDFIKLLSKVREIKEEVIEGTDKIKVYEAIDNYLCLLEDILRQEKFLFITRKKKSIYA